MNPSINCDELVSFQLRAAEGWLSRAKQSGDNYGKFLFYFSGFNALFFLWSKIDHVHGDTNEIKNMLQKFDETKAQQMLDSVRASVEYFTAREPVGRMDNRTCQNPYGSDKREGSKWKTILSDQTRPARDRLVALGEIVYLVRSNLIHGSRVPVHDSEAIPRCLEPLEVLLEESIELTKQLTSRPIRVT